MRALDKLVLSAMRRDFPCGARVELIDMDDVQAPPPGTMGTVQCVDDVGTIHVDWDNGCGLGVAYGVDRCRRVKA